MKVTPELLDKYARQACSEEEKKIVEAWLESEEIDHEEASTLGAEGQEAKLWANIQQVTIAEKNHAPRSKKNSIYIWVAAAASIAIIIGLSLFRFYFDNSLNIYQTLQGQHKEIILSDGTRVLLNADSQLKAPEEFTDSTRMVWLQGEGFFEVAKNPDQPFIIKTSTSQTRVLGTKFNLSAYPHQDVQLTVNEGKVAFSMLDANTESLLLLAGDQGTIIKNKLLKTSVKAEHFNGWTQKQLYFHDEAFSQIAKKIERWYGVKIQIQNQEIADYTYRGFYDNPSLQSLMEDLSFVLKFNYQINENTILIY